MVLNTKNFKIKRTSAGYYSVYRIFEEKSLCMRSHIPTIEKATSYIEWLITYNHHPDFGQKEGGMDTGCMKCEETIPDEELNLNQGLCDKCYIRFCFVKELNSHRENTILPGVIEVC